MKRFVTRWIEEDYFSNPTWLAKLLSFLLLPLTLVYCVVVALKRVGAKPMIFKTPIISIGNLVVGGSGKTPITISFAKRFHHPAIVLRGYGRTSQGLFVVSWRGKILESIDVSGDEAMLFAKTLLNATVIVAEDRKQGIIEAEKIGCEVIFLDDGFSKHDIHKFNILIRPKKEPENIFCLPSGPYREPKFLYSIADLILHDGIDFVRKVKFIQNNEVLDILPSKLVVVTAIANPSRLLEFVPVGTALESFTDHHRFSDDEISKLYKKYPHHTFITTAKDIVKLESYANKLILMDLDIDFLRPLDFLDFAKTY